MDNPETLTKEEEKQSKDRTQHVLDTTMRKKHK
jgi:hypothetical protein